ncbi:uncharacterized protein K489DRAFT_190231 [Dissoconium aciculare CBS 342.82]|uniref:Uncharacterized protein n=1 Tax=Dissoconium aciculare CBS 342.82 TaxID=1314786 RepID=A0A6J3M5B0_9PEZI|nr:uncharacterized protein K489DRAFT_190231 [Dissoconium aciculare CBS 342.82]KAF1823235.1 hypothetical protein K489DRAFT_190231 [Dissoconium aciculare CBS 342.82]
MPFAAPEVCLLSTICIYLWYLYPAWRRCSSLRDYCRMHPLGITDKRARRSGRPTTARSNLTPGFLVQRDLSPPPGACSSAFGSKAVRTVDLLLEHDRTEIPRPRPGAYQAGREARCNTVLHYFSVSTHTHTYIYICGLVWQGTHQLPDPAKQSTFNSGRDANVGERIIESEAHVSMMRAA